MLQQLTDKIYYLPHRDETDQPILGLIVGKKECLLIDAGNSPEHAEEMMEEIKTLGVKMPEKLVITHYHWDHVFGIGTLPMEVIAHQKTEEKLIPMRQFKWDDQGLDKLLAEKEVSEYSYKCIKKVIKNRSDFAIGKVDKTYEESMTVDLGGVTAVIKHIESTHSEDTTVVYVPEEKVLFVGDCIYGTGEKGLFHFDSNQLKKMKEAFKEFDVDHYVASHESICSAKEIEDYWQELDRAEKAVDNKVGREECVQDFKKLYHREPVGDEDFYIDCFMNANKLKSQSK